MRTFTQAMIALPLLFLLGGSPAQADIYAFTNVALTPEQETPPAQSDGKGWLNALYDSSSRTLTYLVSWQLKEGNVVSLAHFHGPAAIGASAGAQIGVTLSSVNTGGMGGSVTLTAEQEADLLTGNWYFNIHSTAFPQGEIRGQLVQNPSGYNGTVYNASTATIDVNNVYVPGGGIYDTTLMVKQTSPTFLLELIRATKIR